MYGVTYSKDTNTLTLDKHDCGLLSNASVIFKSLLSIHENSVSIVNVYWPPKSIWNKPDRLNRNVYDLYFKCIGMPIQIQKNVYFNCMIGDCGKFNFSDLKIIRDAYFNLSDAVIEKQNFFLNKYSIDFENTIGILYRGTDKIVEVPKVDPRYYLKNLDVIKDLSKYRMLVQTDQQQVLEYFKQHKCFNIEEMPLTQVNKAIHFLPESEKGMNNYELGINYLAVVSILSRCKYVVFDTNNAGLWICILRGSLHNTCQIYATFSSFNKFEG